MNHSKQELWRKRLQDYQESGLSGEKWCKKNGIPEHQFWYWKKKRLLYQISRDRGPTRLRCAVVTRSSKDVDGVMLSSVPVHRVYLACGSTDLRKSIDGLASLVQEGFQLNPFEPVLCCIQRTNHKQGAVGITTLQ